MVGVMVAQQSRHSVGSSGDGSSGDGSSSISNSSSSKLRGIDMVKGDRKIDRFGDGHSGINRDWS